MNYKILAKPPMTRIRIMMITLNGSTSIWVVGCVVSLYWLLGGALSNAAAFVVASMVSVAYFRALSLMRC